MITAMIIKTTILLAICVGLTAACFITFGDETSKNRDSAGIATVVFFFLSLKLLFNLIDLVFIG